MVSSLQLQRSAASRRHLSNSCMHVCVVSREGSKLNGEAQSILITSLCFLHVLCLRSIRALQNKTLGLLMVGGISWMHLKCFRCILCGIGQIKPTLWSWCGCLLSPRLSPQFQRSVQWQSKFKSSMYHFEFSIRPAICLTFCPLKQSKIAWSVVSSLKTPNTFDLFLLLRFSTRVSQRLKRALGGSSGYVGGREATNIAGMIQISRASKLRVWVTISNL